MTMFLLMPNYGKKVINYYCMLTELRLILVEVYNIVNMLGPKYLHEMFVVHDSAYDMRNSMNIVMPNFNTVKYDKNSISYTGIYLIMKPNKLLR